MSEEDLVTECQESEVDAVRQIYLDTYQREYPYQHFFDAKWLKKSVYSDSVLMLVVRHPESGEVRGAASIVLDVGARSDLLGEFGRLVVHPSARGLGLGGALMRARLRHAESRLHVALVEARTAHPFSQRIAFSNGFVPVGYLYQKHLLNKAESVVLGVRHFGAALGLRRNHPRIVPEVKALAQLALDGCGVNNDCVVDDSSLAYPTETDAFIARGLTVEGMPPLLRIQRGRTQQREVFGPTTLQHGFFKITQTHTDYLLAESQLSGETAGAVGYIEDPVEHSVKIVELVHDSESAVPFLLGEVVKQGRARHVRYIELDISAHGTRLQRTLVELGFIPAAYIPAMVFADVERLDIVRFIWVDPIDNEAPPQIEALATPVYDTVKAQFKKTHVLPELRTVLERVRVFEGASPEQIQRIYASCSLSSHAKEECLFRAGDDHMGLLVVLLGDVEIGREGIILGRVGGGELLGETSAWSEEHHSVTATCLSKVTVARLAREEIGDLVRRRPDIGVVLYKNLALQLGQKLRRLNQTFSEPPPGSQGDLPR